MPLKQEFGEITVALVKCKAGFVKTLFSLFFEGLAAVANVKRGNVTPTKRGVCNADPETRRQTAVKMTFLGRP